MFQIDFNDSNVRADLLAFVPENYRDDCVLFLGGSLVEGFGNATSDIDIIAVVSGELDGSLSEQALFSTVVARGMEIHLGTYRDVRVDLEVLSADILQKVALDLMLGRDASAVPNFLRPTLNNLKIGIALRGEEEYVRLRQSFPWLAYSEVLVREAASRFNGPSIDAVGAIEALDLGAAINTSRYSMDSASEAFLASLGNTNLRAKWRLRMFERYADAEAVEIYRSSLLEPSLEPSDVSATARSRLQGAQVLLMKAHENLRARQREAEERARRPRRELELSGFANARDIGGLPVGSGSLRYGVVVRAGRTAPTQPEELNRLGIGQVIDLRNDDERAAIPPVDVDGIRTVSLPQPVFKAEQTVKALDAIADAKNATLVHCAMGRDRTSLLVSSLLAVLGASRRVIVDEYMHAVRGWDAAAGRDDRANEMYERVEREFAATMGRFDFAGELRAAGLSDRTVNVLRSRLLGQDGDPAVGSKDRENGEVSV